MGCPTCSLALEGDTIMGKLYELAAKVNPRAYGIEGESLGKCPECHAHELTTLSEPDKTGHCEVACAECGFQMTVQAYKPEEMKDAKGLRKAMGFSKHDWKWLLRAVAVEQERGKL